jgi:hypothetical protein
VAYTRQIATALRLIQKKGESSTLVRRVDGAASPSDEPWLPTTPTETSYTVSAVWLDAMVERPTGSTIQSGDQIVYVAASGLTVTPDAAVDTIKRATGDRWSIISVETLSPNGEVIMHTLHVRK